MDKCTSLSYASANMPQLYQQLYHESADVSNCYMNINI